MPEPHRPNLAYLALGSNIEPEQNLPAAVGQLKSFGQVKAVSMVWQTVPLGYTDQPDFLNAAVLLATALSAQELREQAIDQIERNLERVRTTNKNAPRTIDIDIMLFNNQVLTVGGRHIPDPEVLERPFVAIPLAEIAPQYVHPETRQTLGEIGDQFDPDAEGMRPRGDVVLSITG